MDIYWQGFIEALRLIINRDPEVIEVFLLSIQVSGSAVILSMFIGIPIGASLYLFKFPGRRIILNITHTLMSLPPVVVGLIVFLALARNGPFGQFQLLFTPLAMIIAQIILATPIIAGLVHAAISDVNPKLRWQALSLGSNQFQLVKTFINEARSGIVASVITGFGRVIAEVGAVMMVGGNIKGISRVMTTFIVEETRKGNWGRSIALGLILIAFAFLINMTLTSLQQRRSYS